MFNEKKNIGTYDCRKNLVRAAQEKAIDRYISVQRQVEPFLNNERFSIRFRTALANVLQEAYNDVLTAV